MCVCVWWGCIVCLCVLLLCVCVCVCVTQHVCVCMCTVACVCTDQWVLASVSVFASVTHLGEWIDVCMFGIKLAFESVYMYLICLHMQMCVSGLRAVHVFHFLCVHSILQYFFYFIFLWGWGGGCLFFFGCIILTTLLCSEHGSHLDAERSASLQSSLS